MRDFLNGILTFIGTASLTDVEFDALTITSYGYDQATYDALYFVLDDREAVSSLKDRLTAYFTAKGVSLSTTTDPGKTNIFVGSVL